MGDFEEFQRENARREADAQRRAEQERNADIEADAAYERKHRRRGKWVRGLSGTRRKRGATPIWRLTAGTWAQVTLAIAWMIALARLAGVHGGPQSDADGFASLFVVIGGLILGPVTWRVIGPRARELFRSGVRVLAVAVVVLMVGAALWNAKRKQDAALSPTRADGAAAVAGAAAAISTTTTAPPAPPPPTAPPTAPPTDDVVSDAARVGRDAPAAALAAALAHSDAAVAWRALDTITDALEHARAEFEAARTIPAPSGALARATARLDELATLEEPLRAFALAHEPELDARAAKERGARLALRFAAPSAAHVSALIPHVVSAWQDAPPTALDSLTALLRRGAPLGKHDGVTPIHAAWWRARAATRAKDLDAACRALGDKMATGSARERSLTVAALADLAPRCTAAGPVLLKHLLAQAARATKTPMTPDEALHWGWGVNALAHTGIANAGPLVRFVDDLEKRGGLHGKADPEGALDLMFDRHVKDAAGVSLAVYNAPGATDGAARPTLTLGACKPAQVGMKRLDDVKRLGERSCVLEREGPSLARPILGDGHGARHAGANKR